MAVGLQSTAKIITGAALIMVAVFAGFAAGQLVMLQQMGFGLAVAVLLDATIVRSILVPASDGAARRPQLVLPRWLDWLPDLRVEGTPAAPLGVPEVSAAHSLWSPATSPRPRNWGDGGTTSATNCPNWLILLNERDVEVGQGRSTGTSGRGHRPDFRRYCYASLRRSFAALADSFGARKHLDYYPHGSPYVEEVGIIHKQAPTNKAATSPGLVQLLS